MHIISRMVRHFTPEAHHVNVRWIDTGVVQRAQLLPSDRLVYGRTPAEARERAEDMMRAMKRLNPKAWIRIV